MFESFVWRKKSGKYRSGMSSFANSDTPEGVVRLVVRSSMVAKTVVVCSRCGSQERRRVEKRQMVVVGVVIIAEAVAARSSVERGHHKGRQRRNTESSPSVSLRVGSRREVGSSTSGWSSVSSGLGDLAASFELIVENQFNGRSMNGSFLLGAFGNVLNSFLEL